MKVFRTLLKYLSIIDKSVMDRYVFVVHGSLFPFEVNTTLPSFHGVECFDNGRVEIIKHISIIGMKNNVQNRKSESYRKINEENKNYI